LVQDKPVTLAAIIVTFSEESNFPPAPDAYTDIYAEPGYPYIEV
jgi:hypothetical protein